MADDTRPLPSPRRLIVKATVPRSQAALGEADAARAVYVRLFEGWQGSDAPWREEAETFLANRR